MRALYGLGAVVGLALVVEAALVFFWGPQRSLAWVGMVSYLWLLACLGALVVALRRGESPWFFVVFLLYGLADALYGFYLAAKYPQPQQLRLPPWLLAFYAFFGLAYALWGAFLGFRGGGKR
jgi:hypothetical protein